MGSCTTHYALEIARILQGEPPDLTGHQDWPDPWRQLADAASEAFKKGEATAAAVEQAIGQLDGSARSVREQLYAAAEQVLTEPESDQLDTGHSMPEVPALPSSAQLPEDLGQDASRWLDSYIAYSKEWSPRAFDGFHEACGIWLLSTVAARRVMLNFGSARYTPIFILLASRTSLWAKTTTVKIAIDTLKTAGLDWMLAPDASSPQKFIQDLTLRLPSGFGEMSPARQDRKRKQLAFAGQRGWFYEEFGQQVQAMSRRDGPMAEFRGIIRRFDDCHDHYEYGTIGRGTDYVEQPYVALLGNLTPADLQPFAKRGAALWNDGFWARFAFVTPYGCRPGRGRFPGGERVIPPHLWQPLAEWHERLGIPTVSIVPSGGPNNGGSVQRKGIEPKCCILGDGVVDAFYRYDGALLDIVEQSNQTDFDGNYARFAEKALRIAMLLASLENKGRIEMRHWARAQEIAERWRHGMHALYQQLNEPEPSRSEQMEKKVLAVIRRHGQQTAAEVARNIRDLSAAEAQTVLQGLVRAEVLVAKQTTRTTYYDLPKDEP